MLTVRDRLQGILMDHVTTARNEIEPLLAQLIHQLGIEGRATEMAVYRRIQRYLRTAKHNHELARPFSDLSTTANVCFTLPGEANILLERIIEKAEVLVREMENRTGAIH